MRISYWSSDVCSSDLLHIDTEGGRAGDGCLLPRLELRPLSRRRIDRGRELHDAALDMGKGAFAQHHALGAFDGLFQRPAAEGVDPEFVDFRADGFGVGDRKSTRLNSSH